MICACTGWGYSGKTMTLSLKDRPLYELFEILREEGGLTIVYSREQLYRKGMPVTINMELKYVKALFVLETAAKAAGFTFERKGSIYIILPVRECIPAEKTAVSSSAPDTTVKKEPSDPAPESEVKGEAEKKIAAKPPEREKAAEEKKKPAEKMPVPVIDMSGTGELHRERYAGNFMYGQGNRIYLSLIIPEVDKNEKERVASAMVRAIKDRIFTAKEAVRLFGDGSQLKGKEIDMFVQALYKQVLIALQDGDLTETEIHQLRNRFINAVRNRYEGMK